jgi:hypothetical protein
MRLVVKTPYIPALVLSLALGGISLSAGAGDGIFICTDSQGRKLTSDRPIIDCLDREQLELNPSGTLRRKIGPTLTAQDVAAKEAKERQIAEEQTRMREEKRRENALLIRYPSRTVHDNARKEALVQVDEVIKTAQMHEQALQERRKKIDAELEFYKKDPSKVPTRVKRQIEENDSATQAQRRFITDQEAEKKRINDRFDAELTKLEKLWASAMVPSAVPGVSAPGAR